MGGEGTRSCVLLLAQDVVFHDHAGLLALSDRFRTVITFVVSKVVSRYFGQANDSVQKIRQSLSVPVAATYTYLPVAYVECA